jgi:hypothetical protein
LLFIKTIIMKRLLLLLPLSLIFASCDHFFGDRIRGNGNIVSENRSAQGFHNVHVSNNIDVHITQGTAYAVRVETDQNLMEYLQIGTDGDVLVIDVRNHVNLDPTHKISVYVTAPDYKNLKASGACHFYSETQITSTETLDIDLSGACGAVIDLKTPSVDAGLSGACTLELKGETKSLSIDGSGASEAKCFDLKAENVDVDFSGAGHAEVFASVNLKAEVSGASSIRYRGSPSVNQHTSGASSINKAD